MALSKFNKNVENIIALDDNPNEGATPLTSSELKEKFDKAGADIKDYINNTLTSELDTTITGIDGTISNLNTNLTGEIGDINNLNTSSKDNLVSAVNEVNTELGVVKSGLPKVARGETALTTVNGNNHKDITINYSSAGFTSPPTIVATIQGNSPSSAHGGSSVGVVRDSTTISNATLRYYNNTGNALTMYVNWIAIGE